MSTEVIRNESSITKSAVTPLLIPFLGSLFLALSSKFSIPFPFTGVPFSLQPHAVLLLSVLMGRKFAFLSVAAFLFEGAIGFPVFASPVGGVHHLMGPTGGYLLSYLLVAFFVGGIFERMQPSSFIRAFSGCVAGSAITLFCGWAWLSSFVGFKSAWLLGVYPFLLTDLLKDLMVTLAFPVTRGFNKWINQI